MIWIILIIVILLLIIVATTNSINDNQVTRNDFTIKRSNYDNEISFFVAGGNFNEYLYAILNIANQFSVVNFVHEPSNIYDSNAIVITCGGYEIGYVPEVYQDEINDAIKKEHVAYIDKINKDGYISITIKILYKNQ